MKEGGRMDAFEREIKNVIRRRRRRRRILGLLTLVLVIVFAIGGFLLLNRFRVTMTLHGDPEITLEYGEVYREPGVSAVLSGNIYPGRDTALDISITGAVDDRKTGTYRLIYTADWGIWHNQIERTVHVVDSVAPRIMLRSSHAAYTIPGQPYEEEGFLAADNYDGDLTGQVQRTEQGGKVIYYVEDSSGNRTEIVRNIVYYDPVAPELSLLGGGKITVYAGDAFEDPGFTACDNSLGDISDFVQVTGEVSIYQTGTYELTYRVKDKYDNLAVVTRIVEVIPKAQPETVEPEEKVIYLTFDDGPSEFTERLLEILREYDVKATFFVCNTDYVHLLTDIAAEGHAIGIHSVTHDYYSIYAGEEAYFADLFSMQQIIEEKTGIITTLVRFPGGGSNTVSRFNEGIMSRLAVCLRDMGFQYFDWNVDSDDAGNARTTRRVVKNVTEGIENRHYAVVLQHDTKDFSVEAVEQIIIWGLENGYEFRPLEPTSPTCHHGIRN